MDKKLSSLEENFDLVPGKSALIALHACQNFATYAISL